MLGDPLPESCVGLCITLCTEWILKAHTKNYVCTTISRIRKLHGPASIWEHQQKRKVVTNIILCKRCKELIFQKVALGYSLHFVQNGSSKTY